MKDTKLEDILKRLQDIEERLKIDEKDHIDNMKRLKILEGIEAERKKREEYEEQCCDECGIIPDDHGYCACDEDDDDDYYETDYDREGV